ncbi:HD-GYP domain [Pelotomaculum thermopropionicum SI]|uniref:HD-GYP domain n=1 Tax=Pelotomaculum thermopropionicum (strain DSM 13744 / JCM 10971 / SI) TaxID=370438 RepID=A5D004_PELTS|nr:HD-GYP domain [Pelotomaculum thermopropionicum SI]
MSMLQAARQALATAPPCLEAHSRRVALLALGAAKLLRLPDPVLIAQAAYMHDLGKTNWPQELFTKYPLNTFDWALVKVHPVAGENLALELCPDLPPLARALIRGHHERPGGKGYPDGLAEPGVEILLLAACDAYDAMTGERAYRSGGPLSVEAALLEVARFTPARVVAALAGAVVRKAG